MSNIAIILAGGVGSRVGSNIPKQFIEVQGRPVLAYTIETFQNNPDIDAIEIVCHKGYVEHLKKLILENEFTKVRWITPGGKDFQHSVLNGINNLKGKINDGDIVSIHFGASPFVSDEIISDSIKVCKEKGNAISTTPFFLLSGEKTTNEMSTQYIDRETVVCMNSPHSFKYGLISKIYDEAIRTGVINEVEPHTTTLMYKMGIPIYFSKGSQTNIKITTKEDLDLFEGYILLKNYKNINNIEKRK